MGQVTEEHALTEVRRLLTELWRLVSVWRGLYGPDQHRINLLNDASSIVFGTFQRLIFDRFIQLTFKLIFDHLKYNGTPQATLRLWLPNGPFQLQHPDRLEVLINEAKSLARDAEAYRHNVLAHRTADAVRHQVTLPGYYDCQSIADKLLECYCEIWKQRKNGCFQWDSDAFVDGWDDQFFCVLQSGVGAMIEEERNRYRETFVHLDSERIEVTLRRRFRSLK